MERIEDKSKALSYIGIEIAEALKYIPAPVEEINAEPTMLAGQQVQAQPVVQNSMVNKQPVKQQVGASNIAAATMVNQPKNKLQNNQLMQY